MLESYVHNQVIKYSTIKMLLKRQWEMDSVCTKFLRTRRFRCTISIDVKRATRPTEMLYALIA